MVNGTTVTTSLSNQTHKLIYKICPLPLWEKAVENNLFTGSKHDQRDGFIHFSTENQVEETAKKHFTGQTDLLLIAVRTEPLGDHLKWEPSRNDELFPHLYNDLSLDHIEWVKPFHIDNL